MYRSTYSEAGKDLARCDAHPAAPAIATCAHCQKHVCTPCGLYVDLQMLCTPCARLANARITARPRRWRTAVVVALGVCTVAVGAIRGLRLFDPYRSHRPHIEAMTRSLEEDPCNEPVIAELVGELNVVGDSDQALRHIDALSAVPRCKFGVDFYNTAFALHMAHDDGFAAATDATRLIKLTAGPNNAIALLKRAAAFRSVGRLGAAAIDEETARAQQGVAQVDVIDLEGDPVE